MNSLEAHHYSLFDGSVENEPKDYLPPVGTLLCNKWCLERLLGTGGTSSVFAATHRNGHRVAVKILHPWLSARPVMRRRFLREGYITNAVPHPGIVCFFDDDTTSDGLVFLVMELLHGCTLEAHCRNQDGRLSASTAIPIVIEVLDVLRAAHKAGVVHRDIKPSNVFLEDGGGLKVLDFGVARLHEASLGNDTRTGVPLGTPAYMAPEQARGNWKELGPRTDIWAAGAILFRLLSGRLPHLGVNAQELLVAAATAPVSSLASVDPSISKELCAIVDQALRECPDQRWESAEAMQQALQSLEPPRSTLRARRSRPTHEDWSTAPEQSEHRLQLPSALPALARDAHSGRSDHNQPATAGPLRQPHLVRAFGLSVAASLIVGGSNVNDRITSHRSAEHLASLREIARPDTTRSPVDRRFEPEPAPRRAGEPRERSSAASAEAPPSSAVVPDGRAKSGDQSAVRRIPQVMALDLRTKARDEHSSARPSVSTAAPVVSQLGSRKAPGKGHDRSTQSDSQPSAHGFDLEVLLDERE